MKNIILGIAIALMCVSATRAQEDPGPIRNFLRVNDQFCTGGQPRLEHLEKLKADGVKAIINLRRPTEHRADEEEAKAKELGLRYFNIPVSVGDPKDEQADEFLKITDDPANRPAFIHCTAAIRVGAFWMIRRALRDGFSIEEAEADAKKVGLRENPQLTEFARKYIEKHQKKAAGSGIPSDPLKFGAFSARFDPGGTFTIEGAGWPKLSGTWKKTGDQMEFVIAGGPSGCDLAGKYQVHGDGQGILLNLISDECRLRKMILDRSNWRPATEAVVIPPRKITLTTGDRLSSRLKA